MVHEEVSEEAIEVSPDEAASDSEVLDAVNEDQQPSKIWLSYREQGLIRHPYRGKRNRPKLSELPPRVKYQGTTEDLLRSLGRLDDR